MCLCAFPRHLWVRLRPLPARECRTEWKPFYSLLEHKEKISSSYSRWENKARKKPSEIRLRWLTYLPQTNKNNPCIASTFEMTAVVLKFLYEDRVTAEHFALFILLPSCSHLLVPPITFVVEAAKRERVKERKEKECWASEDREGCWRYFFPRYRYPQTYLSLKNSPFNSNISP